MLTLSKLTIKSSRYKSEHGPGHYPGEFDLTGHIGPLFPELAQDSQWPMY